MELALDSIRSRYSVRTYDRSPLSGAEEEALRAAFQEALPAPFGTSPRFALVAAEAAGQAAKMGTYGLVSGAPAYVVGAAPLVPGGMEDFGYAMEGIVLRAAELGLGTCWLGGVYDRGRAARALALREGEAVVAALAVGRPADRRSLPDRIVYGLSGARGRKPASELFFAPPAAPGAAAAPSAAVGQAAAARPDGEGWEPLPQGSPWLAEPRSELLEALRLGPSASNKQPWRLVLEGGAEPALHLYLHEDQKYNNALGPVKIQLVDMGIAMRHVEAAALALGVPGSWRRLPAAPFAATPPRSYVASFLAGRA